MFKLDLLPHWCITDFKPSIYDVESASAIGQTAKIYGAMNKLITNHNEWIDSVNKIINDFNNSTNQDLECFKKAITDLCNNYISMMDMKIDHQDRKIEDFDKYIKETLISQINQSIEQMRINGDFNDIVLGVFDELKTQLIDLEISISKMEDQILNNLNERLNTVESKISTYDYNSENKTLIIGGALND